MTVMQTTFRFRKQLGMAGFTLVEAIVAIVITGVISAMVAMFITKPVQGYIESSKRAELSEEADLILRRISRDVRQALPNSIRLDTTTTPGTVYLEFIPTAGGGSYRDALDGSTGGTWLNFTDTSSCVVTPALCQFDVIGTTPADLGIASGDFIVVLNFGEVSGISQAPNDAYATGDLCVSCNRAKVNGAPVGNTVTLFPTAGTNANVFATPGVGRSDNENTNRFQIVKSTARTVMYACPDATAAAVSGPMFRYSNYGFFSTRAAAITAATGSTAVRVANNVTCEMSYAANASYQHTGLLSIKVTVRRGSATDPEFVTLLRQVHLDNSP